MTLPSCFQPASPQLPTPLPYIHIHTYAPRSLVKVHCCFTSKLRDHIKDLLGTGSQGRPLRLSHSSGALRSCWQHWMQQYVQMWGNGCTCLPAQQWVLLSGFSLRNANNMPNAALPLSSTATLLAVSLIWGGCGWYITRKVLDLSCDRYILQVWCCNC